MKKLVSVFTALATAFSIGSCLVSANAPEDEKLEISCAKGQIINIPIDVLTGNDFESAQFKIIYAQDSKGNYDPNSILSIKNVTSNRTKTMALTWYNFNGEPLDGIPTEPQGYGNLILYANGKEAIEDGEIATVAVCVNTDSDITEAELRIEPVIFATKTNGEQPVNSTSVVITCDKKLGDSNGDGIVNVRDAARLSMLLANKDLLPLWADYNGDGQVDVRDCAALARACAFGQNK